MNTTEQARDTQIEDIRNVPPEYDHKEHLYTFRGQRYLSATQIVEKFQNPFNTQEVAEKYAAEHGQTPEYWIEKWAEKRDKSLDRGNNIHNANEVALQGMMQSIFRGIALPVHGSGIRDEEPWYQRPDGIYTERKLWHHGYRIAGRADKIILSTPSYCSPLNNPSRIAHIEDYKTNEKLEKVSYRFRSGNYKMMKPPLAHIMDSNWWHYCLQLSIYMFMLEYQGFTAGTISVIYYPHKGDKESHKVPYLRKEVVMMLSRLH